MENIRDADSALAGKPSTRRIKIGLAGNPNSGKTTIFNELTGAHQKVGNWPGVTVEVKQGVAHYKGCEFEITDLPGTYSLSTQSKEERIARDFVLDHRPDVIIQVVEGPNLERNLYLTTQLIELEVPIVIALNMYDEVRAKKIKLHLKKLSELLNTPMVPTIGRRGKGMRRLLDAVLEVTNDGDQWSRPVKISYGHEVEDHISELEESISLAGELKKKYPIRWLSLGLIEGDEYVASRVHNATALHDGLFVQALDIRKHLAELFKTEPQDYITDRRYGFISGALKESMKIPESRGSSLTEKIDDVLTNRILGLPILFFLMWLLFQATFGLGQYPMAWIEASVEFLGSAASTWLPAGPARDLIVNGIIGGVGSVMVFLPNILILFLGISLLEDTGYMARAAFVTDRVMHALGLHGKSFIPLIMGFGCSVPAVMATRMLESKRDRILTMLIVPLMSCSARLPIYILLAGTFFPKQAGNVIFGIYIFGILMALIVGRLLSSTLFKGDYSPFVMELPSYRLPTLKSILIHMWYRAQMYLRKMGGVILVGSIILWFLGAYPKPDEKPEDLTEIENRIQSEYQSDMQQAQTAEELNIITRDYDFRLQQLEHQANARELEQTFIGRLGKILVPVVQPLGFDWKMGVALLSGFVAKEVVVSSMGVLYAVEAEEEALLQNALKKSGVTPLVALGFMVFSLLYTPCIASMTAICKESGSYRWMIFSIIYQTALAWMVAFVIYQGGRLLGVG